MRRNKGFTLLEVIIAITLTTVIVAILYSALRLSQKSQEKGLQKETLSQKMRIISDRLSWIIKGAYPYLVKKDTETRLYFIGESDRIGLITTSTEKYSPGPEDSAGLKWVELFADEGGLKTKESVFFLEENLESGEGREYVFDKDVKSIEFEYLETDEESKRGSWVKGWDFIKKQTLPSAVRIRLVFEFEGKDVEMPLIIAGIRAIDPAGAK